MASSDDIVCPFPGPPEAIGELSRVRGTLIASSIQALRARGLFERYSELLTDSHRDRVLNSVAGEWLTLELALAHYSACDALGLSVEDQIGMGRDVSRRTHETFLGLIVKMARGVGVTPWVVFPKINSLYTRIFRGGGIQITRLGSKHAEVRTLGLTPLDLEYFRNAYLGMYEAGVGLFASSVQVRPLSLAPSPPSKDFVLHVAWQ
ncbi:MAG TPA: hypothetical protein VJV79_15050 [Polyangiaceae bacterium]|nr:hypothetical protein [Polyangiaceae bacterium]